MNPPREPGPRYIGPAGVRPSYQVPPPRRLRLVSSTIDGDAFVTEDDPPLLILGQGDDREVITAAALSRASASHPPASALPGPLPGAGVGVPLWCVLLIAAALVLGMGLGLLV